MLRHINHKKLDMSIYIRTFAVDNISNNQSAKRYD